MSMKGSAERFFHVGIEKNKIEYVRESIVYHEFVKKIVRAITSAGIPKFIKLIYIQCSTFL